MPDRSPNPLPLHRSIPLIQQPLQGLHRQQIHTPLIRLLPDRRLKTKKRVRRVAPLIVPQKTPVKKLEVVNPVTQTQRPLVPERITAKQIIKIQLRIKPNHLEFIDVPIVLPKISVVAPGVLHLESKPKGIQQIMHPQIKPCAMQQRLVQSIDRSPNVVIAILISKAIIQSNVQPVPWRNRIPASVTRRSRILRRIRISPRAVAISLTIVTLPLNRCRDSVDRRNRFATPGKNLSHCQKQKRDSLEEHAGEGKAVWVQDCPLKKHRSKVRRVSLQLPILIQHPFDRRHCSFHLLR